MKVYCSRHDQFHEKEKDCPYCDSPYSYNLTLGGTRTLASLTLDKRLVIKVEPSESRTLLFSTDPNPWLKPGSIDVDRYKSK